MIARWIGAWLMVAGLMFGGTAHAQSFTKPPEMLRQEAWQPASLPDGWVEVPGLAFTIHGHEGDLDELNRLSRHGAEALPRLARALDVPVGGDVRVYLVHSDDEFRSLQPSHPPIWADGTAYPSLGVIFLRHPGIRGGAARPLEQVLDHELVHILLGRAFHPVATPRWLQEGVAQVYAGEAGPETTARLSRGLLGTQPYTLEQLARGFPADAHRADLAYAQSADFIGWFRATWGEDAVQKLIRFSREGRSLDDAIQRITGETLAEVDTTWRARIERTVPTWLAPENVDAFLWGGTGMLILVVGFLRRRAWTRRLARWKQDDAALDALTRQVLAERTRGSDPG